MIWVPSGSRLRLSDARSDGDQLEIWRRLTEEIMAEKEREFIAAVHSRTGWGRHESGLRRIGGGAPSIVQNLARLDQAQVVNSTWTAPQSIISASATPGPAAQGPVGPFSVDYFKTLGAHWTQEAHGVISTTGTPTIAFGTYFGTVAGTIATVLNITPAITTASALANISWYWTCMARTTAVSETTATTFSLGILFGNIEALAATVAGEPIQYAVNATPPTAVITDLSSTVFIDLKATWGTSSTSNQITANWYALMSLYA